MLDGLTNSEGLPTLQRLLQFTAQRHRLISHNIANLSTPGFRPLDVSPAAFQEQLRGALDARRRGNAAEISGEGLMNGALGIDQQDLPHHGALNICSTAEVEVLPDRLELHARPAGDNILFHDGNDRSVERVMQDMVENFMMFRAAAQLMRSRLETINLAIRERP